MRAIGSATCRHFPAMRWMWGVRRSYRRPGRHFPAMPWM
jgi:hypothetical protein